ncbi:hypothetical protein DFH07DRAFT_957541 [Mycena maculata]|uniref:Uncharacterized protein n=1 Tax=Mycena maculata TaxID=230809 RepID=A0AAD7JC28_9AGAR|nr:hypothetical protein DFH07DRAFT_957541 [Mycena maculata]
MVNNIVRTATVVAVVAFNARSARGAAIPIVQSGSAAQVSATGFASEIPSGVGPVVGSASAHHPEESGKHECSAHHSQSDAPSIATGVPTASFISAITAGSSAPVSQPVRRQTSETDSVGGASAALSGVGAGPSAIPNLSDPSTPGSATFPKPSNKPEESGMPHWPCGPDANSHSGMPFQASASTLPTGAPGANSTGEGAAASAVLGADSTGEGAAASAVLGADSTGEGASATAVPTAASQLVRRQASEIGSVLGGASAAPSGVGAGPSAIPDPSDPLTGGSATFPQPSDKPEESGMPDWPCGDAKSHSGFSFHKSATEGATFSTDAPGVNPTGVPGASITGGGASASAVPSAPAKRGSSIVDELD